MPGRPRSQEEKELTHTLKGQVALVTGASSGIGQATARALARQGARVVLAARRLEKLQAIEREIAEHGGDALAIAADLTDAAARERLIRAVVERYGRVDALINNAGFGQRGPIEMVPVENIRKNFETNLFSLIALTQLVIPIMRAQSGGRIVNIGSVAGKIARPFSAVYDSTKHALEAVSDGLRGELAPFGIQMVLIEPGFILTSFQDVAREVAEPLIQQKDSPYAGFMANLDQSYQKMQKYAGMPEDIAALVVRALTSERPKARYAAPRLARFFLAIKWLLPGRLFDSIVYRQMGLARAHQPRRVR